MKKILVFGMTENMGGVESFLLNYYEHFDTQKVQLDFLCNTREVAFEERILKRGGNVYRIPPRKEGRKKYHKALEKFFEQHAEEYAAIWENVCSLANIDYLIYAKRYGIPCRIIHSHSSRNMDSKLRGILHHLNKRVIHKYATDYWACSVEAGEWFYAPAIINSQKYRQINNAIDTQKFVYNEKIKDDRREELGLQDTFLVGNVGRLSFPKNQLFLLDVFCEIAKCRNDARLVLIGTGEDAPEIERRIQELKLEEKVFLLGMRGDVPELLQAMDVFLFPSLFEGLPVVAIEAQAAGLPVFASKEGIPQETNITGLVHYISLSEAPSVWAEIILNEMKVYDRQNMSENIRKAQYDIVEEADKLQAFFEEIGK